MATKDIFNARSQQVEQAELTVDHNNEIVATFADGSFLKFPNKIIEAIPVEDGEAELVATPVTPELLDSMIAQHEEHNQGQEIITPEMEAANNADRAAAFALIGEEPPAAAPADEQTNPGNPMPEGDKTNAPADPPAPAA